MGVSVGRRAQNQNPVKSALDQIMSFMPMMYATRERNRRSLLDRMEAQHKADRGIVVPALATMAADPTLTEGKYNQQINLLGTAAPTQQHRLNTPYEDFRMAPEDRLNAATTAVLGATEGQAFGGGGSPFLGHVARTHGIEGVVPGQKLSDPTLMQGGMGPPSGVVPGSPAQDLFAPLAGLQEQYRAGREWERDTKKDELQDAADIRVDENRIAREEDQSNNLARILFTHGLSMEENEQKNADALNLQKLNWEGRVTVEMMRQLAVNKRFNVRNQTMENMAVRLINERAKTKNNQLKYTVQRKTTHDASNPLYEAITATDVNGQPLVLEPGWMGTIYYNAAGEALGLSDPLGGVPGARERFIQGWKLKFPGQEVPPPPSLRMGEFFYDVADSFVAEQDPETIETLPTEVEDWFVPFTVSDDFDLVPGETGLGRIRQGIGQ